MNKFSTVIGIDLGDKFNQFCIVNSEGEWVTDGRVSCERKAMTQFFANHKSALVAMEAGTHSAWVSAVAQEAGHEVLVANPRKLRAIYENERKSDKVDAEMLARIARMDPNLLKPIRHRGKQAHADLALLKARQALVEMRTKLVNHIRGTVKSYGHRLPPCSTPSFHKKTLEHIPEELLPALKPLYGILEDLTERIKGYEQRCEQRCSAEYPETEILRSVPGVGPLTSLAFVTILEHPDRFPISRNAGAFVGLTSKRNQSGASDPQLRISKAGDPFLRKLLVGSAQYILGPFGPPSHLRTWGLKLQERGGKGAKKRAVVAVARKLAVILHRMWVTGALWEPFPDAGNEEGAAADGAVEVAA